MVCRLLEPVGFKTFKIFLSPICCAVYAWSKGLKSIGNLCLRPESKNSQTQYSFCESFPTRIKC